MTASTVALDAARRAAVIDGLLQKLHQYYIFPEIAQKMDAAVRVRLSSGEYDGIVEGTELAQALTRHVQEVSRDKHLRVVYSLEPRPTPQPGEPSLEEIEEWREDMALQNFGFHKIERLPGNIGYLDLRGFFPARLGGETAVAAMQVLAHAAALIVDLRENGGGDPEMIALISSYLVDQPTHLNNLYWREGDRTQQFWTLPYVPGKRFGGQKPVYVLTSSFTFSGAEEFAYNLQNLKRATIIGEVTGGGAHPGDFFSIDDHFGVNIPTGRAINPLSQANWEGIGVKPDVETPADEALAVAEVMALKAVLEQLDDKPRKAQLALAEEVEAALAALEGEQPAQ